MSKEFKVPLRKVKDGYEAKCTKCGTTRIFPTQTLAVGTIGGHLITKHDLNYASDFVVTKWQ